MTSQDEMVGATHTALIAVLTLEEKVRLLTGRDTWSTWPIERIGLRSIVFSDGPSGVRGPLWDERSPSLNLPSATVLASSWDPEIARRYGNVSAQEARRKGVDVVLGPTINLHRSPLGGRHFEAFSEDPWLTAELAAAYVMGVQENGVGATVKHYVANEYETERFTASSEVDERTLREVYLRAFEKAVVEARVWVVMSSYNSINGVTASENDLLETPLNSEWGFDGVVVSDWTAVRSVAAASASQDLAMPGPDGAWGAALVEAVRDGQVSEAAIDRKVARLLTLAQRVGALESYAGGPADAGGLLRVEDGVAFAREAAAEGTVLLANDGVLPLDAARLQRVAVIGQNAVAARTQGGGSATVIPERVVSPWEGIVAALPDAEVTYRLGAVATMGITALPLAELTNPSTGGPGVLVRFLDDAGVELMREDRFATSLVFFAGNAPTLTASALELSCRWTPTENGDVTVGFASIGRGRISVDGALVLDDVAVGDSTDVGANILDPPKAVAPVAVSVTAGRPVDVVLELDLAIMQETTDGAFGITLGVAPSDTDPEARIADAVAVAAASDLAIVVVGTNAQVESEGFDRSDLRLPGRQDDLVAAVAATGTPTVVVVNSGSPVELPWRDDVSAIVLPYFGGQEMGNALADVLLGRVEPGGRLPTTWAASMAEVPVLDVTPVDGKLEYAEGIHLGYRAWLRAGLWDGLGHGLREVPRAAYPFGFGLGYTTWELRDLVVKAPAASGGDARVGVTVTNTGARRGKQVVQVYLARPESGVDRPVRWLAGHAVVRADADESVAVEISVPARAFAHWQNGVGWAHEPGTIDVLVGTTVDDVPLSSTVTL